MHCSIVSFVLQLEPKGQRRIKFAMGNLVMALGIFCVWYMSLALSCNEPWFCDVEVGGSSTIHRPGEVCFSFSMFHAELLAATTNHATLISTSELCRVS